MPEFQEIHEEPHLHSESEQSRDYAHPCLKESQLEAEDGTYVGCQCHDHQDEVRSLFVISYDLFRAVGPYDSRKLTEKERYHKRCGDAEV